MSQFTSRSEFDIEKRVQFTNEIPPYDMYDSLNSVLQTDLWKWVLGFTKVEFGLPYSINTQVVKGNDEKGNEIYGVEKNRDIGIENGEVYYKMVNGKVVDDVQYGPSEKSNSTYHKLEEYGVVLPEFDYLLHEVYRYMGSLYPNHPDLIELLTPNEFDDMVTNAGALIDYEPDNKFFDKVASSFDNLTSNEIEIEAAMLKIRNLNNESFRKRVYGSKMGYRMLANDIFQTATVFPVATYLPLKPVSKSLVNEEFGTYNYTIGNKTYNQREFNESKTSDIYAKVIAASPITDADKLKQWNESNGFSFDVNEYKNYILQHDRVIDTYSKYYYKKFRLIDINGSKSSYPAPVDNNIYFYGYTIPFYEYNVFEYPACSDTYSKITSIPSSSTVESKDFDSSTSYVMSVENDIPLNVIEYIFKDGSYGDNVKLTESVGLEVHNFKTSIRNYVPYKKLTVYPPLESKTLDNDKFTAISVRCKENFMARPAKDMAQYNMLNYYYSTWGGKGFTKEDIAGEVSKINVIYNPFIKDTLLLTPSSTISFYPHSVDIETDVNGNYYFPYTKINWDLLKKGSYIAKEDLSEKYTGSISSVAEITNFTKGYLDIYIDPSLAATNAQLFNIAEDQYVDDRYAVVIENEEGNLIILEGKMTTTTMLSGGRYQTTSEHFDIAAIPRKKTDFMMTLIYPDYMSTYNQTLKSGYQVNVESPITYRDWVDAAVENGYDETLARNFYSDNDEIYQDAKNKIDESGLDYTDFLGYIKNLIKAEEQIAAWKENSSYLFKNVIYTVDGEPVNYEETLVRPTCKVKYILRGAATIAGSKVDEYNVVDTIDANGNTIQIKVFNEDYYQNFVTYSVLSKNSGFLTGDITNISLGNLNVVSLYGIDDESGNYIPSTNEVINKQITLTSESTNESIIFNCIGADDKVTIHDNINIFDYNNVLHITSNNYTQSISTLDDNLRNYTSGLSSSSYTNFTIIPIIREDIQIESVVDIETEGMENVISFKDDTAKELFKSLSIGDIVTGPSIDSDDNNVYITYIGDNYVTLNVNLQQSGTFLLTYSVKNNVTPNDVKDDLLRYKEDLYNNGLYSVTNPFQHGLWPSSDFPRVSTAILDSLPDVSFYDIYNYRYGNDNSFTHILEDTHYDDYLEIEGLNKYLLPSDIKFNNELFLELNLNKLIKYPTHKTSTNPILMSVDWLDYLDNSLMYSSRATDKVNVGVNLMMETDTTGFYTLFSKQQYTDPQIRLKFITLNLDNQNMWPTKDLADKDWVTPCYAQIGTGGSGRRRWFKSPEDITYPSVWGSTVFDNVKDERTYNDDSEFYRNNGELRNVGVWGQDQSEINTKKNTVKYTSVENPLFEIPLGEYDTVTKYLNEDYQNIRNLLTITQVSFYSQTFTNLLKYFNEDESNVKIIGSDINKNDILISYGDDSSRTFTYAGVWVPKKTPYYDNNGIITDYYSIVYPESPLNMTYYVVAKDTNLSNIGTNADNVLSKEYNRSDVLFRFKNKWYLKSFQYLGLVGDGFDKITENVNNKGIITSYSRINVTPDTNEAVSVPYIDNDSNKKYYTLVERLIQYYLRAAGNVNNSYYTNVIPKLGFNFTYTDVSTRVSYTLGDAFKNIAKINPIHNDHLLYYIYAGTFNPTDKKFDTYWSSTKNRNWLDESPNVGNNYKGYSSTFNVGDRIALVNFNEAYSVDSNTSLDFNGDYVECMNQDDWYIFKINTRTLLGCTLPISQWRNVQDSEMDIISDNDLDLSDNQKCGISTYLNKICSTIKLPRSYITEGSYNFNITIDPHFTSEGYLYKDDNTTVDTSKMIMFCTTKGSIYYDDNNDMFYTFSNIYENGKFSKSINKIAIKFNEQKFFKNVLKVPGIYQLRDILESGESSLSKQPTVRSITGIDFPVDKLATGDRLLEVKSLDLRSVYSTSLEPVFFSNYFNVNYPIKGVTKHNELYLSYIPNSGSDTTTKLNFTTSIMNLLPVNKVYDSLTDTYTTEPAVSSTDIKFGNEFGKPSLSNISITKALMDDLTTSASTKETGIINREFAYYKNNLIFRGRINTANPKVIIAPNVDVALFNSAVSQISSGDSLVGAYALEPTGNEEKFKIGILYNGALVNNASIQYAYFANNQFMAVQKNGIIYYNKDIDIPSVTSDISCQRADISTNKENALYFVSGTSEVQMVGWTQDLGWYIEIDVGHDTTIICSVEITANGTVMLSQAYMKTGKHVYVDYNNSEHTLVGHTIGEYNKDYLTLRTLTILANNVKEGLQIMNEDTEVTVDTNGNTVWLTKIKNGDNLSYSVKTTIENVEEFVKAIITDTDSQESIINTFDGSFGNSTTYNVEKIDKNNNVVMYVMFEEMSSTKDAIDGIKVVPEKQSNGSINYTTSKAKIYVAEGDSVWKTYTYGNGTTTDNNTTYTYEKSDELLKNLNDNGVVKGIGDVFETGPNGVTKKDAEVFYRDIALSSAKLTQDSDDSNLYSLDSNYISEPYFTDTVATVNPNGTKNPIAKTLKTRAILCKDNSGKYEVYAKGRSLFIKSPTSLVSKDNGTYSYTGNTTPNSFWKLANAPIFEDNMFLSIRSTVITDKGSINTLIEMSMMRMLEILGHQINLEYENNGGVKVDGRDMSIDYDNDLLANIRAVFKQISGYTGVYDAQSISFNNKVTYDSIVAAMDYAKKNKSTLIKGSNIQYIKADGKNTTVSVGDGYPLLVSYSNNQWSFRCYGFRIIEETITDGYSVIGASKQKFAELAPTVNDIKNYYATFTVDDDAPTPNYEHAFAMFAFYYSYYLCGNAEDSEIISSSNISNIQFTDNSMLVTDVKGNINTIALSNLHNRDDIENPDNWATSNVPNDLSFFSTERDVTGVTTYKVGQKYVTIPRPEVLAKQNLFYVNCSYANDRVILLGGYIYSKTQISAIYDDAMRGDKSNAEYTEWKNNRSSEEKDTESALLERSKFQNVGTPVVLYSVDNGNTFNVMTLSSTKNMSLEWESSTEPDSTFYVSAIVYANKEYKVFVKKEGDNNNLDYYYYLEPDIDEGTFDFSKTTGSRVMDEYGDISEAHEFDLDATTGTDDLDEPSYTSTMSSVNTVPSGYYRMMFIEGANCFYILSSKAVRCGDDVTVTSKSNSTISVSMPLTSSGNSEFDVLLAFNIRNNVTDTLSYLNEARTDKYLNVFENLRVPEVTLIDDETLANRFYSYREILQPTDKNPNSLTYDPLGYPSVDEDDNHSLYEYNTVYNDLTGETIYSVKPMTNKYGEQIYLCDSTGKYLIYVDKDMAGKRTLGTISMRRNYLLNTFEPAPTPVYTTLEEAESIATVRPVDDTFRSLLDFESPTITAMSYGDNPYLTVSTENTNLVRDLKDYLYSEDDTEDFASYLMATTSFFDTSSGMGNMSRFMNADGVISISRIKDAISDITYKVDPNSLLDDNYAERFTLVEGYTSVEDSITTDTDTSNKTVESKTVVHLFWYDNYTNSFILKNKRYISALAYVPYCFMAGITAYKNVGFPSVTGSGGVNLPNPVTGVYLSNYGYGGSRSNTDLWSTTMPWIVDPDAFIEDEYLKNTNGDNVYLVDATGKEIYSYNSETSHTLGETFSISIDNMNNDVSKDIYAYYNAADKVSHKIYNLKGGDVKVYVPLSSFKLGENPFEINFWIYQSYKLVDIDTITVNNKKIPNITFKYYGLLKKNVYGELACGDDFVYDPDSKTIRYQSSDVLKSFYVNTDNTVDVSKITATFYVNGVEYTKVFDVSFDYNVYVNKDNTGRNIRTFELSGSSSHSIIFDNFTLYQDKSNLFTNVSYEFADNKIRNSILLNLKVYDIIDIKKIDLSISTLNINQNCIISTQYDINANCLIINNAPNVSTASDSLKISVTKDDVINVMSLTVPIFEMGKVSVFEDYIVTDCTNGILNNGYWKRQTFIDNIKLDNKYAIRYNEDLLTVSIENDLNSFELCTFNNEIPNELTVNIPSTYYLNFLDGSVFDSINDVTSLRVSVIKLDSDGNLPDTNVIYTNGVYGKIACKMPVYDSFRDLINAKQYVIEQGSSNVLYKRSESSDITVGTLNTDDLMFTLNNCLGGALDDTESHYILMKWLTQSTVRTEISTCNDMNAFVEISMSDTKTFPPDRVWFNPNGYPTPVVTVGKNIYNPENNDVYESDSYKNNNGYTIYRCNKQGKLVGYVQTTDSATIKQYDPNNDGLPENAEGYITDDTGKVKSIITEFVLDPFDNVLADAQIPKKPMYESCQDWFKNEFYIKGHESNPYWQVLKISSKFNNSKKVWEQYTNVCSYVRSTQEMILDNVNSNDAYINPVLSTTFQKKDTSYIITSDSNVVNLKEGSLSFILDKPAEKYQTESTFIKYGITAFNPFFGSDIWSGNNLSLSCYLDSTYTVCSTKNLADSRDTESEIQEVTELGLFNKNHELIAYAVFPPIEYRTSSQHISFTCFIKQGSCVDPKTLDFSREANV